MSETWRLMGRTPVKAMEAAYVEYNAAASGRSFEQTGTPMGMMRRAVIDGFTYMSVRQSPDDLKERQERHAERVQRWLDEGTSIYEAELRDDLERRLAAVRSFPVDDLTAAVKRIRAAMEAAAYAHGEVHWWMNSTRPFDWPSEYTAITGRPAEGANVLLRALPTATVDLIASLRDLARIAATEGEQSAIFDAAFAVLLARYGTRNGTGYGSMVSFETPSWELAPDRVLGIIRQYAKADLDRLEASEQAGMAEREQLAKQVRAALADDPERLARFERAYWQAQAGVLSQENSNDLIEQRTIGTMKWAIADAGARFTSAGLLNDPADVWFLSPDDLAKAASTNRDLGQRVAEHKGEHERRLAMTPPELIGDADGPAPEFPFGRFRPGQGQPAAPSDDGVLRGTSVYPGQATGRARVAAGAVDPPEVEAGDILVATDSGPAWTPIFPLLAGVVMDGGAYFQHAAITAREYGIPCVIGTGAATSTIPDGATITVDGTTGEVRIVSG